MDLTTEVTTSWIARGERNWIGRASRSICERLINLRRLILKLLPKVKPLVDLTIRRIM